MIDISVGRIVDKLEADGELENTVGFAFSQSSAR